MKHYRVPAYDVYFKKGLKDKIFNENFNEKSLRELVNFYRDNKTQFDEVSIAINTSVNYPTMKLVDMYFWMLGGGNVNET